MVPSNFGYSLREAGHHFRRNWTTVLGAIVTIFLSLFIIGLFVLGSVMISSVVGGVEDSVTIQAYLSDDATDSEVEAFQSKIEGWDNVESVSYKSKDEALEEYRDSMSNRNASDAVAALDGENPLPASLVITLNDPQEVAATAEKIMEDSTFLEIRDTADDPASSPADDVVYGQGTVDRLFEVTNYIRIGAVALVEVKTRRAAPGWGPCFPEESVTAEKRNRYRRIAACWAARFPGSGDIRFHVVAVRVVNGSSAYVKLFEDPCMWDDAL